MPPLADRDQACLRAIFAICRRFSLDRGERLELATWLLNREVTSFATLSSAELSRMRDALEGAVFVCTVQMDRRAGQRR